MSMQIVSVPLFNREMSVEAYLFRYRRGNDLFSTSMSSAQFDGATRSEVLELLNDMGLDTFTLGKQIFVPISPILLLSNLEAQSVQPPEKIIFLFEDAPKSEEPYLSRIAQLCSLRYRFAVSDPTGGLQKYDAVLGYCSYCFLSQNEQKKHLSEQIREELQQNYRHIRPVAASIDEQDGMEQLYSQGFALYENRFYRVGVTKGETSVSPLKANSIRLLNTVQDENFEFEHVAAIVQRDPALTISLLRMVNAPNAGMRNKIKTIPHAVAMLGQQEVRKWVTTAVAQSLGNDRPNEITRISLVRAKFADNLAPLFEMAHMAQGLFLMGLFSVLDIILEVPMEDAMKMVHVSDLIRNALVDHSGTFYPVLNMLESYERADWSSVSRLMIVHDVSGEKLAEAYLDAINWYKNMVAPDTLTERQTETMESEEAVPVS